jgi:hypothetical protein
MGLEFALDELYATGWSDLDSTGCGHNTDGRGYPKPERVRQEFAAAGFDLTIRRIDEFRCYRAEWRDEETNEVAGGVVGHSEAEAAVYALAQLRRRLVGAGA